jgi:hypothetical protein
VRPAPRLGIALLAAGVLLCAAAPGASSSDISVRAKFLGTMAIFNGERGGLAAVGAPTRMRTDMIVRRALLGADQAQRAAYRAGRSLTLQGLNEVIDALAIDEKIVDGAPSASIVAFSQHWVAGVRLFHPAGVQLGVYR